MVDRQGFAVSPTGTLIGFGLTPSALAVPLARQALAGSNPRESHDNEKASGEEAQELNGGPAGVRTLDLGIKSPLLYQLSYRSVFCCTRTKRWGGRRDSNPRPPGPQPSALPTELRPPFGHLVTRLDYNAPTDRRMQGVIFNLFDTPRIVASHTSPAHRGYPNARDRLPQLGRSSTLTSTPRTAPSSARR